MSEYRNLDNPSYWQKRSEERVDKHWKSIKNVEKEMAKQYRVAMDDIRTMISDVYTQYSIENKVSYQEALKTLNASEIGDYKAKMDRLLPQIRQTNDPFLIAEYEKLQKVVKLNRLQALMGQIDGRLLQMGHEQQMVMEDWLVGLYETNYYQAMFQLQVGTGLGVAFVKLNHDLVKKAVTFPWSGDQFSDRIWTNKTKLVAELRQTITQGFIKGESVQKMASNLKTTMNSSYSNSLRLVRTETAYVIGESTAQGYKESGYLYQYRYVATLDGKTSSICRKLDTAVFKLEDRQVGKNASPMHPNCRSTEVPHFNGDDLEESLRIARGEDGETYYVPANLSYKEWHKQYVEVSK